MKKLSKKLIKTVNVLATITCLIIIGLIIKWIPYSEIYFTPIVYIFLGAEAIIIVLIWLFYKRFVNIKLSILSFNLVYLLAELIIIILPQNSPNKAMFFTNSIDSGYIITDTLFESNEIRGYKLISEDKTCRNFKMTKSVVEYDVLVNVNNIGVSSHFNYNYEKPDSVKRYLVFGDSFSAGLFMDTSWVDKIQYNFIQNNIPIELYNFSVDGGGIINWHSIFINEIIPNYEFDGIIFMSYLDNLRRSFIYLSNKGENVLGSYHNNYPPDYEYHLSNNFSMYTISDDKEINNFINYDQSTDDQSLFSLPLLEFFIEYSKNRSLEKLHFNHQKIFITGNNQFNTIEDLQEIIGVNQYNYFTEIIDYCKENDKKIILTTAPEKIAIKHLKENGELTFNRCFNMLSQQLGVPYYNTYNDFIKLNDEELKQLWFPYDYHWNQKGSNYFAKNFEPFLLSKSLN